jgi:uncharacterized radical SAM superfamily protein
METGITVMPAAGRISALKIKEPNLLAAAWQLRRQNFAPELHIYHPVKTLSVSVTGASCALKCAHCGGHYLSAMTSLASLHAPEDIKARSCLISGGCTPEGKVPVSGYLEKLARLKGPRRYNFHVGLLSEAEIKALAPLADMVSFDFLGADSTIQKTLKLHKTVADYQLCYELLRRYCTHVAPHICLGLEAGRLVGEGKALELLAEAGLEQLVFIVLRPTAGTEYAKVCPPPVEEVAAFLAKARLRLPDIPLTLGCMRPGGAYRQELDALAVEAGLNGIVQPAAPALTVAHQKGLILKEHQECCVL